MEGCTTAGAVAMLCALDYTTASDTDDDQRCHGPESLGHMKPETPTVDFKPI